MGKAKLDDYIEQGIYGAKQIKPDERRKFLGTIRERVVITLTTSQVMEAEPYPEVLNAMKENKKAQLLLNGNLDYSYHSKYIKRVTELSMEYTMVNNKDYHSELGLVLAYDYAIDQEEIYVAKKDAPSSNQEKNMAENEENEGKGLFSAITKIFKKD
ncbi:YueI family protein [Cytobacillus sp. Hz8]|uniref:YueI family protein n=1 Tax=Cytobacillus sp. Hz8 TaxID=3347168 RepID=UPI0035DC55BF